MIKTDKAGAYERVMDEVDIYGNLSDGKTGTVVLGLIIWASCGMTHSHKIGTKIFNVH